MGITALSPFGRQLPAVLFVCLPLVSSALPEFTEELAQKLWDQATKEVKSLSKGDYVGQSKYSCSSGTWGDGPQCNQWDAGWSPCWPSAMTVSAAWDKEIMARWSREMGAEFGLPNRGQLAPGVNIARFPWNGRLGEYMSGEDPYFGARMVEVMVKAYRDLEKPPLQTVKHYIPNTIEKGRMDFTEVVDERTLFEVYYPAFDAAVQAGMSAVMCSYNLVHCTTGMCDAGRAYACSNHDTLAKHLKGVMGFKGIVISDWDATKCQETSKGSGGCSPGSYIDSKYAASSGLDLEMPDCQSLGGGFTNETQAFEAAVRTRWAYLVQGRQFEKTETGENKGWFSDEEVHASSDEEDEAGWQPSEDAKEPEDGKADVKQDAKEVASKKGAYCCFWPEFSKKEDVCGICLNAGQVSFKECSRTAKNTWCMNGKAVNNKAPADNETDADETDENATTVADDEVVDDSEDSTDEKSEGSDEAADAEQGESAAPEGSFCCYWAPDGAKDVCEECQSVGDVNETKCTSVDSNTWCEPDRRRLQQQQPRELKRDHKKTDSGVHKPKALFPGMCHKQSSDNVKSPCKLDLANQIIAEASVVLKNEGGVLPIAKDAKVALAGAEACSEEPLAIGGGSGWNGESCQKHYYSVKEGIADIKGASTPSCPDEGGENSEASSADVIVVVVTPEKACEGRDRSTLQLEASDVEMIKKYSAGDVPVVVVMNVPGPMITNTWDSGVAAVVASWLPGTQNGIGIAKALYADRYEASGRLPFTFPKCSSEKCTPADEFDGSIPLGDQMNNSKYWNLTDRALIGYRWYHAKGVEPNYAFGHGLVAYGAATIEYTDAAAAAVDSGAKIDVTLTNTGTKGGKDVPQLYLRFPDSVPGEPEIKPEWVLRGFEKVTVEPDSPVKVTFNLTSRDLSYWDDSPGMSKWVCPSGTFTACVGANAKDAVAEEGSNCVDFKSPCASPDVEQKFSFRGNENVLPASGNNRTGLAAVALVSATALAAVVHRALRRPSQAFRGLPDDGSEREALAHADVSVH